MNMLTGTCPKCGGDNLEGPESFRNFGINKISCNHCRYTELYGLDSDESVVYKRKIAFIWLICVILPITVSIYFWLS
jgi:predicted nucleic-acid-binding Zn-ribbon protein|tara:strand:- start:35 stop:265 length:231 start_codon:yes stop_codon:yes gene_type:complete